jgi:urease accessory protein
VTLAELPITDDRIVAKSGGGGAVQVARSGTRSVVTRALARSPLKLLTPKTHGDAAWIFTSTYGGGLVGGDQISLDLHAAPQTRTLLSTQASTKIYRTSSLPAAQQLTATVGEDAILLYLPDPIVCFAGSNYRQHQRFDLADNASLVMVDWLTSGRRARGERWAFDRYESHCDIWAEGRCAFRDAVVLDPNHGGLATTLRMGRCDCFATIVLLGQTLRTYSDQLIEFVHAQPIDRDAPLIFSASPIVGGVVCRVAGATTETVAQWIRQRLAFVPSLLGQDPWLRKW